MDVFYWKPIREIVNKSTLKPDERKYILELFDHIGLEYAVDLFYGGHGFTIEYIDDNTLNQLKEIAISYIGNKYTFNDEDDKYIIEFIELLNKQRLLNAQKKLAFAKSLNERTAIGSLLENVNIDVLIKIGEICGSFLNFYPLKQIIKVETKNKVRGGGKRRKKSKKKKSKSKRGRKYKRKQEERDK